MGVVSETALTALNWRGGLGGPPTDQGGSFNEVMFVQEVRVVTGGKCHRPVKESGWHLKAQLCSSVRRGKTSPLLSFYRWKEAIKTENELLKNTRGSRGGLTTSPINTNQKRKSC